MNQAWPRDPAGYGPPISQKHVDFVLCGPKDDRLLIQLVIDLTNPRYETARTRRRDAFVDRVLTECGIPVPNSIGTIRILGPQGAPCASRGTITTRFCAALYRRFGTTTTGQSAVSAGARWTAHREVWQIEEMSPSRKSN